jgi:hypothetical protein
MRVADVITATSSIWSADSVPVSRLHLPVNDLPSPRVAE